MSPPSKRLVATTAATTTLLMVLLVLLLPTLCCADISLVNTGKRFESQWELHPETPTGKRQKPSFKKYNMRMQLLPVNHHQHHGDRHDQHHHHHRTKHPLCSPMRRGDLHNLTAVPLDGSPVALLLGTNRNRKNTVYNCSLDEMLDNLAKTLFPAGLVHAVIATKEAAATPTPTPTPTEPGNHDFHHSHPFQDANHPNSSNTTQSSSSSSTAIPKLIVVRVSPSAMEELEDICRHETPMEWVHGGTRILLDNQGAAATSSTSSDSKRHPDDDNASDDDILWMTPLVLVTVLASILFFVFTANERGCFNPSTMENENHFSDSLVQQQSLQSPYQSMNDENEEEEALNMMMMMTTTSSSSLSQSLQQQYHHQQQRDWNTC